MKRADPQVWRYYLLSVRPEMQDTDFKWSDLQSKRGLNEARNQGLQSSRMSLLPHMLLADLILRRRATTASCWQTWATSSTGESCSRADLWKERRELQVEEEGDLQGQGWRDVTDDPLLKLCRHSFCAPSVCASLFVVWHAKKCGAKKCCRGISVCEYMQTKLPSVLPDEGIACLSFVPFSLPTWLCTSVCLHLASMLELGLNLTWFDAPTCNHCKGQFSETHSAYCTQYATCSSQSICMARTSFRRFPRSLSPCFCMPVHFCACNRGLMFVSKFFGGKIPEAHASKGADQLADLGRNVAPKVSASILFRFGSLGQNVVVLKLGAPITADLGHEVAPKTSAPNVADVG
eukprot:1161711-Pelagomonas_calceolata.AAC.3